MQFQVKGQDYFLAFVEDERRWYLFAPKPEGIQRISVYVDTAKYGTSQKSEHVKGVLN